MEYAMICTSQDDLMILLCKGRWPAFPVSSLLMSVGRKRDHQPTYSNSMCLIEVLINASAVRLLRVFNYRCSLESNIIAIEAAGFAMRLIGHGLFSGICVWTPEFTHTRWLWKPSGILFYPVVLKLVARVRRDNLITLKCNNLWTTALLRIRQDIPNW